MTRYRHLVLPVAAGVALAALCGCSEKRDAEREPLPSPPGASVRGTLRIGAFGAGAPGQSRVRRHRSVWVDGPTYAGMEDNDLRGFLDGTLVFDWNQPTQVHVRAGRWRSSPRWGEYEIFRTLQRWGGVWLPPSARVDRAALHVSIEKGAEQIDRLAVMLYAVNRDWDPGTGGRKRNNTSQALPGSVVWNQRAHGRDAWTLPGVSFASDTHPDADTGAAPLAEAAWVKGQGEIVFESPALATYVQERARARQPLLFLVKLSDADEDRRRSVLHFFSANVDTDRNPDRRPHLVVDWESPAAQAAWERPIHLEHGRDRVIEGLDVRGATLVALDFAGEPGSDEPTLEIREGGGDAPWRLAPPVFAPHAGTLAVRVRAARAPIARGDAFEASFRNTWVRTAKPEDQRVEWTFIAPSGDVYRQTARYAGDVTWSVHFEPPELGRWRGWYDHDLSEPYRSADAVFDVVPGDCANVARQLRELPARIEARYAPEKRKAAIVYFGSEFWQLERAASRCDAPDSPGPGTRELREPIAAVRRALMPWDPFEESAPNAP